MNLTLVGQLIAFVIFAAICYKFIWPHVTKVLDERRKMAQKSIQASLASQKRLAEVRQEIDKMLLEAHEHAAKVVSDSHIQAKKYLEDAENEAEEETRRLLSDARRTIESERDRLQQELSEQTFDLVLSLTSRVLKDMPASEAKKLVQSQLKELA